MSKFRIIQTRPTSNVLPYEVEECHQGWLLLWVMWRPMKERRFTGTAYRTVPRRFHSPEEAQDFIKQVVARRASREAGQARLLDEQRQQRQLPRVVQVFGLVEQA